MARLEMEHIGHVKGGSKPCGVGGGSLHVPPPLGAAEMSGLDEQLNVHVTVVLCPRLVGCFDDEKF